MPARGFLTHDHELPVNKQYSPPASVPWPFYMKSGSKTRDFNFDQETFGEAITAAGEDPHLHWPTVGPMPDSPPRHQKNRRQRDQYHGKGISVLLAMVDRDE
ncbi:hypothetical protein ARMGADRAFT_1079192 [Armillaria gallica]|uniref:Uncharacterized protein n=1 Tax=Armillaria gallica TaxID=47427 RepID=A0A2H3E4A7_ARMGA|nr:hypothetical protein ARMGADRAFT_1079192 [Armillaria gallica]